MIIKIIKKRQKMNKNRLIKKDPKFGAKKGAIFYEINNNYKQEIIHHYKVMIIITINLIV